MSTLLITGAASGIGKELVLRALDRGDTVFAAHRSAAGLSELAGRKGLHLVHMDVASNESVEAGFAELDRLLAGARLNGVIHSAAVSSFGALELMPLKEYEDIFNTNTLGTLRIMKAAIPRLRGHDGRLILVTSLWGKVAGPMLSAYAASKHAIEALADAARRETAGMDFRLTVVEPGVVITRMYTSQREASRELAQHLPPEHQALYGELYEKYAKLVASGGKGAVSVSECAAQIEAVLAAPKPRPRYRIGKDSKLVGLLGALLSDRAMDRVFALMLR